MKILVAHNTYQRAGGEDTVFETECAMLVHAGHEVIKWEVHNDTIDTSNPLKAINVAIKTIWNWHSYAVMRSLIRTHHPDIVHFHNTFPLISPSVYWACKKEDVPVVQTLHNYRLCCLNAYLFQNGSVCEKCLGKTSWRGVRYRCYRDSLSASMTLFMMLMIHRILRTWTRKIDAYIVLTEFGRQKMIETGLPKENIFVKPNAIDMTEVQEFRSSGVQNEEITPALLSHLSAGGELVLYAGRLSSEKGVDVLLRAWKIFTSARRETCATLVIAGDGNERQNLEALAKRLGLTVHARSFDGGKDAATTITPFSVIFTGHLTHDHLRALRQTAAVFVVPSLWYETFGMGIVESFAQGVPVIVSNIGGQATLVQDGVTGWHFNTGDEANLADKLAIALSDPRRLHTMKTTVREWIAQSDSADKRNVQRLLEIYGTVIHN